jgi:hypothetical protein
MSCFTGTHIPTGLGSSSASNILIDEYLTPRLMSFRQIHIHDEPCNLSPDDQLTWSTTFGCWLEDAPLRVWKMGQELASSVITDIDYEYGTFKAGAVAVGGDGRPREEVTCTYWFDYFPVAILEGFFKCAVQIINASAVGSSTSYTMETAPTSWYGVMTDLAFAQCMEKLLLDYDLWRYRLLFAIGPNEIEGGGGDIVGQLETLKQNAEERANRAMDNEKFKSGNYLAPPTIFYYDGIRGMGGSRGAHGIPFLSGRLRGYKPNSWV